MYIFLYSCFSWSLLLQIPFGNQLTDALEKMILKYITQYFQLFTVRQIIRVSHMMNLEIKEIFCEFLLLYSGIQMCTSLG